MGVIKPNSWKDMLGSLSLFLSLSLSYFAFSDVSFNKRVKQNSTGTLREAVNHSKPEATNTPSPPLVVTTVFAIVSAAAPAATPIF